MSNHVSQQSAETQNKMVIEDLFTINETCRVLKISRATLYRMIKAGQLETVQVGSRLRIDPKALRELLGKTETGE